jgi:hypothetical protein
MKKRTISQIVHKYALINAGTNEWVYEGTTYVSCINMVDTLPPETEFTIVAVMKEGKTKKLKPAKPDPGKDMVTALKEQYGANERPTSNENKV